MPENRISNQQKRHRSFPFITDLAGINGVMLSKDETVLYVIEYRNRKIHAFGWNDQAGTVGKGKLFSEIQTEGTEHGADGMAIDDQNRLYVCCLGGIWVFNRTGQQANFISLPEEKVTNCAFAGEDYNTLYITTQKSLFLAKR